MKSFTDREKAFVAEFKRNQELRFRLTARRSRLFGLSAARLGLPPGEEADVYARAVVAADLEAPGDGDVIGKVRADLDAKGIAVTARPSDLATSTPRRCFARTLARRYERTTDWQPGTGGNSGGW